MLDTSKLTLEFRDMPASIAAGGTVTVRVSFPEDIPAGQVLSYISGGEFRKDIDQTLIAKHAPGCGLSLVGGPRPVFENPEDRQSKVGSYEQTVNLVKWG